MKLFKLLSKLTQDNFIEIIDSNNECIFCGNLNENCSLSFKLLSAKVVSFRPVPDKPTDDSLKYSALIAEYEKLKDQRNALYDCDDIVYDLKKCTIPFTAIDNAMNARCNAINIVKMREDRALKACMCYVCTIPTEIKVDIIKEQLGCNL